MTITLPCLMIVKIPQTKVKYFVLVFLTKCFIPPPPSGHPQSVIIDLDMLYKWIIVNLDIKYSYTCCTIKTIYKMDDRTWIREDTLTMLLAHARLRHLQKTHILMKWCNNDGATG